MMISKLWEHGVYGDVHYSKNRRSKLDFFSVSFFLGNLALLSQLLIFIVFMYKNLFGIHGGDSKRFKKMKREELILHLSYSILFEEGTKKEATMKVERDKKQMSCADSKKRKELP
jgi:hypothetical protein